MKKNTVKKYSKEHINLLYRKGRILSALNALGITSRISLPSYFETIKMVVRNKPSILWFTRDHLEMLELIIYTRCEKYDVPNTHFQIPATTLERLNIKLYENKKEWGRIYPLDLREYR